MLKNFRTYQLSIQFYRLCLTAKAPAHLRDQLLRASSSVALNLAEGFAKRSMADQHRFYNIAMGSLRECQAICELLATRDKALLDLADHLGASLYKLSANRPSAI